MQTKFNWMKFKVGLSFYLSFENQKWFQSIIKKSSINFICPQVKLNFILYYENTIKPGSSTVRILKSFAYYLCIHPFELIQQKSLFVESLSNGLICLHMFVGKLACDRLVYMQMQVYIFCWHFWSYYFMLLLNIQ